MSQPPLPLRSILTPELPSVWGYILEQMQADRKQVREAALEEAAMQFSEWRGLLSPYEIQEQIRSIK